MLSLFTLNRGVIYDNSQFRNNPVDFGTVSFHETLHLKGSFSVEVSENEGEIHQAPYREGVSVRALQKHGLYGDYPHHFFGLHEAIISYQQKKSFSKLMDLGIFKKEKERLESEESRALMEEVAIKNNIPADEVFWVDDRGEYEIFSYLENRRVLEYVCSEIAKEFSDQYSDEGAVFAEFLCSHFTGRLLKIARLVEKTFGKGSFRLLGNMTTEEGSGNTHLEAMRKARYRESSDSTK